MYKMPFQALFDHSSIGIIISNKDGVIEKSNSYASKMFGYHPEELIGQKIEILIPQHLKEKHAGYREQYNKNPQPRAMGSNLNLLAVKKNGEQFPVEISLSYFESEGYRSIVSFVNDITARKKSEVELKKLTEELESKVEERTRELSDALLKLYKTNSQMQNTLEKEQELNELKSRFVSMASHEFRTPLSGILTSASLISSYKKADDEPKREKHIQTIKKSVRNLTIILNDFLSLDKFNHGKVISNPSHFSLIDLIDEIVEEFQTLSDKDHQIKVEYQDASTMIYQDREMLRNVIINLLSNAIKYSPEKSNIYLKTYLEDSQVVLEVQDQGMGIPDEDQKHLFELFFRANNVSTMQGTGLGLNIVKRYLDIMGGSLKFSSTINKGTTFTVIFPMEKQE